MGSLEKSFSSIAQRGSWTRAADRKTFGATMNARQLALLALQKIERQNAYADLVLEHLLAHSRLIPADRHLVSELVYGITRRRRTLDALIDCFARRSAHQQPPDLRLILHLGLYQLAFLDHIPPAPPSTPAWNWPARWAWDP